MGRLRPVLLAVLAATAMAAAEDDPLLIACADGATILAHWQASPFGRVWGDPALAGLRQRADAALADAAGSLGSDLAGLVGSVKGLQFRILPDGGDRVRWAVQADLGTAATRLRTWTAGREAVAVPHADEAWRIGDAVVARFGTLVALGGGGADLPLEPARPDGDIALRLAPAALLAAVPDGGTRRPEAMQRLVRGIGRVAGAFTLGEAGSTWHAEVATTTAGWIPADRRLLERLPALALNAVAVGIDGPELWRAWGPDILAAVAEADPAHPDAAAVAAKAAAALAAAGIPLTPEELVTGLRGTVLLAQTPGMPIPGMSLAVPRSPAMDRLAAAVCAIAKVAPPTAGQPALIPLGERGMFQLMLIQDEGHWLATTDASLVATWPGGAPGGWAGTPAARNLATLAPEGACLVAASDTAAYLRVFQGFINLALNLARELSPAERQAALIGIARFTASVAPGAAWCTVRPTGFELGGRGEEMLTMVAPVAIIAAIAIPNLLESRVAANEAATAATIKSAIFPAEVQFQAGGYEDQDADNVGEYGLLSELSGRRATAKVQAGGLKLLQGPLAAGDTANGYRYALYLPDGKGGAIGEPDGADPRPSIVDDATANADVQEKAWVVYAWPLNRDSGRRMFAMGGDGQLRSRPWNGEEPAWNALWDGAGWDAAPAWEPHKR